ncbi:CGNR zinc finger domain-containing protein [Nocardia sp. NPDC127526]|uniref:CGNR zinc finger domain-containing protein n=1 Tax=Nocardia sp. NPDC127526 TaxID=3345393 RepID=UPI00362B395C
MADPTALRLANTIRATSGGLTDAFATTDSVRDWLTANAPELGEFLDPATFVPTEQDRAALVELRQHVRALFAKAVAPEPPSGADASALPPFPEALAALNAAAAPLVRELHWDAAGPSLRTRLLTTDELHTVKAVLADAAIEFCTGPTLPQVRVCPAPRCVLYFLKGHPRQEWCSVACGNRARAARHYHQHRAE